MKILFVTSNRLGDAVLSTGIVAEMLRRHPDARFTVACGPAPAALFQACTAVDKVIVMRKGKYAKHWRDLWGQTAFHWWDAVIDLRASAISYLVPTFKRYALPPKSHYHNNEHRVELISQVIKAPHPCKPRLWWHDSDRERIDALYPTHGQVLALGPTANWGGKMWRPERFVELAHRLTAHDGILPDAKLALFGAPNERDMAAPLFAHLPKDRVIDCFGDLELPTVACALNRAALYVGNDSGLMHMAAAAGCPTLGLFGPSRHENYGPWGNRGAYVRGKSYEKLVTHNPKFDHRSHETCMDDLTVDMAQKAAEELLARIAKEEA